MMQLASPMSVQPVVQSFVIFTRSSPSSARMASPTAWASSGLLTSGAAGPVTDRDLRPERQRARGQRTVDLPVRVQDRVERRAADVRFQRRLAGNDVDACAAGSHDRMDADVIAVAQRLADGVDALQAESSIERIDTLFRAPRPWAATPS